MAPNKYKFNFRPSRLTKCWWKANPLCTSLWSSVSIQTLRNLGTLAIPKNSPPFCYLHCIVWWRKTGQKKHPHYVSKSFSVSWHGQSLCKENFLGGEHFADLNQHVAIAQLLCITFTRKKKGLALIRFDREIVSRLQEKYTTTRLKRLFFHWRMSWIGTLLHI